MPSASTGSTEAGTYSVSPWQQGGTSRRVSTRKCTKQVQSMPIKVTKDQGTFNSSHTSCSANSGIYFQEGKVGQSPVAAGSSGRAASCNCSGRHRPTADIEPAPQASGPTRHRRRPKKTRLTRDVAAAELMGCCVQNTAEQAKHMHVRGTDCRLDNPYAALRTDTFRKLLKTTGSRTGAKVRKGKPGKKSNIKWCRPKVDECDGMRLQLCPHLGEGHTHEKLIEEVTPMLLRASLNVNCQLHEICRRLFFMKQNVPQLTAPALLNFHAILTKITGMLIADFTSFPTGLKLPERGSPRPRSASDFRAARNAH